MGWVIAVVAGAVAGIVLTLLISSMAVGRLEDEARARWIGEQMERGRREDT